MPRVPTSQPAWCATAGPAVPNRGMLLPLLITDNPRLPSPQPLQNWSQQAPCMLGSHMSNSATHFSYSSQALGCELAGPLRSHLDAVIPGCAGSGGPDKGFSGSIWTSNHELPITSFWFVHLPRAIRIDVTSLWLTAASKAFHFTHTLWKMDLLC